MKKKFLLLIIVFSQLLNAELHCPVCENVLQHFVAKEAKYRRNCVCYKCGSLDRHRHGWLVLSPILKNLIKKPLTVLHWAPEAGLAKKFLSMKNINYIGADYYKQKQSYIRKLDITHTNLADDSVDIVICNHVLEHVADDRSAMKETFRVLRPGGFALITVPLYYDLATTYEDFSITSKDERAKHFDHWDHVRKYGKDFFDRLKSAGFVIEQHLLKDMDENKRRSAGLIGCKGIPFDYRKGHVDVFICRKPSR